MNSLVQDVGDHPPLGFDQDLVEAAAVAARLAPRLIERTKAALVDEQARDHIEPFVAGGAGDAGKARQPLPVGEDLFDHHVEFAAAGGLAHLDQSLQPAEILMRVAQAVDVVEPQALQPPLRDQTADERVHGLERAGVLDAQPGERIDVEKTPVVDLAAGQPPMRQPIVLALEQMVQGERRSRRARLRPIGGEPACDHLLAARHRGQLGLECRRLLARRIVRAAIARRQFDEPAAGGRFVRAGLGHDLAQDFAVAARIDRQPMLVVPGGETAFGGVVAQLDLARFERLAVRASEDRHQDAAARVAGQNLPIDVERRRVRRPRPPFQHVEPPGIVGVVNPHVVGHEIEDEPDVRPRERRAQTLEGVFAAELGIERIVIDDVIAVAAARARLEKRRRIEVTDAEALR